MSQNTHAIVGFGSAPEKAILESLRDAIRDGDDVGITWYGKPSETQEVVYDYVLDNEVPFVLYYSDGSNPPKAFREAEHGTVQKVRDPEIAAVKTVEGRGSVLFMWDQDRDDDQIDVVADHLPAGSLVLELTNGLAPISFDVDVPEPEEPEVPKDEEEEEDDTSFSKDELETMTAVAVKRYGARIGAKAATKRGIIDELFPEDEPEDEGEVVADREVRPAPIPTDLGEPDVDPAVADAIRGIADALNKLADALTS